MVNRTDSNITDNVDSTIVTNFSRKSPSFKRLLRQLFYLPMCYHKLFNKKVKEQIEAAVYQAEEGHFGEIRVVIEGNLPLSVAYTEDTHSRAIELFSLLRVWDTEHNSGVLIYTNLCEKNVSIVADRGINSFVTPDHWQHICDQMVALIKDRHFTKGICLGVDEVGATLREFYHARSLTPDTNELPDAPVFM